MKEREAALEIPVAHGRDDGKILRQIYELRGDGVDPIGNDSRAGGSSRYIRVHHVAFALGYAG